jgi:hypothetical protein
MQGFKVGVVCADTFRAGAYEQLQMNTSRVNVAFYGSRGCYLFTLCYFFLIFVRGEESRGDSKCRSGSF